MAYNRLIGNLGEDIACRWLERHQFRIIERNYNKKWGEIDIVAEKDKILQFIEVKSVTDIRDATRPEENVHGLKVKRLRRVLQTYMIERHYGVDIEFRFHVMTVKMNVATRRAKVNMIENVIL
jgi:putative endonuclease